MSNSVLAQIQINEYPPPQVCLISLAPPPTQPRPLLLYSRIVTWMTMIQLCLLHTNAANVSAVWKYFKLSEKDAKLIRLQARSTDCETV